MMTNVILHGALADKFPLSGHPSGRAVYRFEINSAAEAIRALACAYPGRFLQELSQGEYRIVRGDFDPERDDGGIDLPLEMLAMRAVGKPLHLVPVIAGAKRGGAAKVILGVALIAAAAVAAGPGAGLAGVAWGGEVGALGLTYGNIANFGLSMALSGAASLLSPQPKAPKSFETADRRASFLFNGPVTGVEQGGAIPVIYGRVRAGGTIISASITVEDVSA
jgi:predicted phage tail protein